MAVQVKGLTVINDTRNIVNANTVTAVSYSGNGTSLTSLNASNLGSGTIPDARFPATLPAANGSALTSLNASQLSSGTIPDARFPSTLPAIDGSLLTGIAGLPDSIHANASAASNTIHLAANSNVGIATVTPAYKLDVTGDVRATGNMYSDSDERLKENITIVSNPFNVLDPINGVYFNWKDDSTKARRVGLIAQQVEQTLPEAVSDQDEYKSVSYDSLIGVLVEAVKELKQEVELLKARL